jgi:hypothetical protein
MSLYDRSPIGLYCLMLDMPQILRGRRPGHKAAVSLKLRELKQRGFVIPPRPEGKTGYLEGEEGEIQRAYSERWSDLAFKRKLPALDAVRKAIEQGRPVLRSDLYALETALRESAALALECARFAHEIHGTILARDVGWCAHSASGAYELVSSYCRAFVSGAQPALVWADGTRHPVTDDLTAPQAAELAAFPPHPLAAMEAFVGWNPGNIGWAGEPVPEIVLKAASPLAPSAPPSSTPAKPSGPR